jgi:pyocin large subunit-like protein
MKTKGFLNSAQLQYHFQEHGMDFSAKNVKDYERMADVFLGDGLAPNARECMRRQGDKVRFNPHTDEYGVIDTSGVIRTYFKPTPCASIPTPQRAAVAQSGRCHGQLSNTLYFQSECKRW